MNILLAAINAKYIHSNPAIYCLWSYASKSGLSEGLSLAEYTINQQRDVILADLYERRPDVIAFSCYIWNIEVVFHLLEDLQQLLPDTHVWLGGPEVSFHPQQIMEKYPYLKGIMIGEGEETFRELVTLYRQQGVEEITDFQSVAGLYTRKGYTSERECMNLDSIPFFYEEEEINENQKLKTFENRIIYYESSRGCPFRCSYCLSSIDKKLRLRSIDLVKKELQFFLEAKLPQVKFIDRTFNANHEHCMEIWKYIRDHDNGVTNFHFEISADLLREDEIILLQSMREGLVQLEIGVQTTNIQTIEAIHRSMNLQRLKENVASIREKGNIHQHLDLIAGLPYEGYDSFHQSFNDVYAMKAQQLQLGFLKVLKGSEMEANAESYGIRYHKEAPYELLYTKWLSYDEVLKLKQIEEMVELFYNSRQFTHAISYLEYLMKDAFLMFEQLASFYKKNGFLRMASKRILHYEHFLMFITEYLAEEVPIFKELLLYDCYLRENLKSYPEFARAHELTANKQTIEEMQIQISSLQNMEKNYGRLFYQEEEVQRKWLPNHKDYDSKQMAKMTHMEFFRFPVWESDMTKFVEECKKRRSFESSLSPILFDYSEYHYTTGFCRTVVLGELV